MRSDVIYTLNKCKFTCIIEEKEEKMKTKEFDGSWNKNNIKPYQKTILQHSFSIIENDKPHMNCLLMHAGVEH